MNHTAFLLLDFSVILLCIGLIIESLVLRRVLKLFKEILGLLQPKTTITLADTSSLQVGDIVEVGTKKVIIESLEGNRAIVKPYDFRH